MWNHETFGARNSHQDKQGNKEREIILEHALLPIDLTSDILIKSSVRHILRTEQPFFFLCENSLPLVLEGNHLRVTTVAYESHCVFVSSLHCDVDFIMKYTLVLIKNI
jgi:hypothetical protein